MESTSNQDSYIREIIKWTSLFILLSVFVISAKSIHEYQLQKITASSELLNQKTFLVTQMHKEMLSITRVQYQILHASNQDEVRQSLWRLSEQVSDYLLHYHQLEAITDSADVEILTKFSTGFEQWHRFNKDLLGYANIISDTGFINTLNMIDLAFAQFNSDADEKLLLISQLKQGIDNDKGLSN